MALDNSLYHLDNQNLQIKKRSISVNFEKKLEQLLEPD